MIVLRPLIAESLDLLALLNVEGFARLVRFESGRHEVHALLCSPAGRRIGGGAPPNSLPKPLGMGLDAQKTRRVREHRLRVWLGKQFAVDRFECFGGVAASHVGVRFTSLRLESEVAPPVNDLLG